MTNMTDQSSAGASPWERDLYAHLSAHVEAEKDLLGRYDAVAGATPSKALRYLVELLVDDERRHHRFFAELADSVKIEALSSRDDPPVPYLDFSRDGGQATRELTDQLIKNEEEDVRELKRLHRELRDVRDTSLWTLLVELMQHDTEKHLSILRFVAKHSGT
jgi:rubrerythrin